jgi:hypothetical protein
VSLLLCRKSTDEHSEVSEVTESESGDGRVEYGVQGVRVPGAHRQPTLRGSQSRSKIRPELGNSTRSRDRTTETQAPTRTSARLATARTVEPSDSQTRTRDSRATLPRNVRRK